MLIDSHIAIIGASGAGKTTTARHQVEQLLSDRRHVCIIDPTGGWWGLRSSADGAGPGFDIPIFGGAHGDVPIDAEHGDAVGSIIADGVSAIVDLSHLRTGAEQRRFTRDLLRRLRRKPDGNFHLVVDEADEFAAQKPRDDYGFQVGEELIWMAKRGRLAGFVLSIITQRPASIDKEVLSQAQTLIVHQLVAPVDQKPVVDYLKDHADRATLSAIKGSLASLERGERWIYSPRAGVLERGVTPLPATFDSSRSPLPGEARIEPKMLAQIDMSAIRAALQPVEDVKAVNDLPAADISGESLKSHPEFIAMREDRDAFESKWLAAENLILALQIDIDHYFSRRPASGAHEIPAQGGGGPAGDEGQTEGVAATTPRMKRQHQRPSEPQGVTAGETAKIGAERKPLAALVAVYPSGLTEPQWALAAGFKRSGGTWGTYRSRLRSAGLIEHRDGRWFATEPGASMVGPVDCPPPAGAELVRWWVGKLQGVGPMAEVLIAEWPNWISRDDLAARIGMSAAGGSFGTYLSRLVGPGLIERDRERGIRLSDEVMTDGL